MYDGLELKHSVNGTWLSICKKSSRGVPSSSYRKGLTAQNIRNSAESHMES